MKNTKFYFIFLITLLLLTCSISIYSSESKTAKILFDNREVILKPNGTWEYLDIVIQYTDDYIVMGNSAKINNISMFVNSAHYEKSNNKVFLVINCSIQNLNSIPIFISSLASFTLRDVKGYYQNLSLSANINKSLDCRLMPKETIQGEIAYEIDLSNEYYWALSFNPDLINPGQVVFAIMKEQVK